MQLRIPMSAAERRYINSKYNTATIFQPQSGDILIDHMDNTQPKAPEERHINNPNSTTPININHRYNCASQCQPKSGDILIEHIDTP
ncbi:hypothetical protein DFQ11_102687 [Winogradskyella epiphytica]|uniref:Uncharacterized protein n=2 Tax=Winogradskyella epiphytica TaxID=262005 RepID=A0A2V4WXY3_9FLAO|nr:hypothetical protein DFQ11_102687 [Winogradskyella epiphytica]